MLDTMTLTKITGAVCGAMLVFLLGSWVAQSIYGPHEGGHGEEHAQAYSVEVPEAAPADGEPAAEVDVAALLGAGDASAGEKVFGKCASCHKLTGEDATGPHLNGVVNRAKASIAGFAYSDAILGPKEYMPGTIMGFAGLAKPEDRANVIAYLATTQP
jgi:cytochrome c